MPTPRRCSPPIARASSPDGSALSFLYPRTIAITRPRGNSGIGVQPYGGATLAAEDPVASGIAASIQLARVGGKGPLPLSADAQRSRWRISFKGENGLVRDRDIITDDLGVRYQVSAAYWNSLGYACECERLEA